MDTKKVSYFSCLLITKLVHYYALQCTQTFSNNQDLLFHLLDLGSVSDIL